MKCENCKEAESTKRHLGMELCNECTTRIDHQFDKLRDLTRMGQDRHSIENCTHPQDIYGRQLGQHLSDTQIVYGAKP